MRLETKNIKNSGRIGSVAVQNLRIEKLRSGLPFMINSRELPPAHCYLEYPDGTIQLATISSDQRSFRVIRELSQSESSSLRKKYNLVELHA